MTTKHTNLYCFVILTNIIRLITCLLAEFKKRAKWLLNLCGTELKFSWTSMDVTYQRSARPPASSKELCPSRYLNPAEDKWAKQKTLPLSTTSKIRIFECNCQCKNWIGKFLLNYAFQIINQQKNHEAWTNNIYKKSFFTVHSICVIFHSPMQAAESSFINPPDHSTM